MRVPWSSVENSRELCETVESFVEALYEILKTISERCPVSCEDVKPFGALLQCRERFRECEDR
jgi:Asp-tRNA(Asn)/Glu-tRNA(Gln) amidotransferase C subunit